MKKLTLIAGLLLMTVVQGCHMSARADFFYKSENGGKVWKSRPGSSTAGGGNATDRWLRRNITDKIK